MGTCSTVCRGHGHGSRITLSLENEVLVVIGKGSGIMSLPGDARANLTVSPSHAAHDLAVKFVKEVSTSAVRFFAAESLLVLVSLSFSGVSLRLSGLLA